MYGNPIAIPISEEDPKMPISPYGISKHMVEQLLETYSEAYGINYVGLRYFNAAGADPQGRHGQEKAATHIIARVMEAIKEQKQFTLNGTGLSNRRWNLCKGLRTCCRHCQSTLLCTTGSCGTRLL